MTVPFGMMKRTCPSEATSAQPAEPSRALTVMSASVLL
jgi:hypothetical protein